MDEKKMDNEFYSVDFPGASKDSLGRITHTIPVLNPHEVFEEHVKRNPDVHQLLEASFEKETERRREGSRETASSSGWRLRETRTLRRGSGQRELRTRATSTLRGVTGLRGSRSG